METACFNGRRAANVVLERTRSRAPAVTPIEPYQPPEWEPLRQLDEQRWAQGQPNIFDTGMPTAQRDALLSGTAR
jgi:hypothetical protein